MAWTFCITFRLDLALHGLYKPATSRQAVSFPVSERTTFHPLGFGPVETAPTSTHDAQTLSTLTGNARTKLNLGRLLRLDLDA